MVHLNIFSFLFFFNFNQFLKFDLFWNWIFSNHSWMNRIVLLSQKITPLILEFRGTQEISKLKFFKLQKRIRKARKKNFKNMRLQNIKFFFFSIYWIILFDTRILLKLWLLMLLLVVKLLGRFVNYIITCTILNFKNKINFLKIMNF